MYFAGLNHNQGIESLALFTTLIHGVVFTRQLRWQFNKVKEAGDVKTLPSSTLGRFLKPVFLAGNAVPFISVVGAIANGLEQPLWMQRFALPDDYVSVSGKAWLRTFACLASLACTKLLQSTLNFLGAQWHYIGVREKAKVVSTGPYAYVRHPLYSIYLAQLAVWGVAFWSYVPFVFGAVTAIGFVFKIPIEEKLMEDDSNIGSAYKEYKAKVTARIIPYVW